jgi:hypothetical protein
MPTLEEMLQTTLKGVHENYEKASGDLHRAVAELAKAVQAISKGRASVVLKLRSFDQQDTLYDLEFALQSEVPTANRKLSGRRGEQRLLGVFSVPPSGYPFYLYADPDDAERGRNDLRTFNSSKDIADHIQSMVTDPASPIVALLAYALRQQVIDTPQSPNYPEFDDSNPVSGESDNIPF